MKLLCLSLWYVSFWPINYYHQDTPQYNVSHSISILLGLLRPSKWHYLKQSWKTMMIKHLLASNHYEHEMHQICAFKEHEAAFRNNCHTSNFAKHLIEEGHSFGPIHSIMQVLHYHRKGAHLNTLERFHIHTESAASNHLNDNHTILPNAIFDTLAKKQ